MRDQQTSTPTVYSYIVTCDRGSAPNPFHRFCTLAICKPDIRRTAKRGDYVIGLAGLEYRNRAPVDWPIVYAMKITKDPMPFDEYWDDPRFRVKQPKQNAGGVQRVGDNIYHRDSRGEWIQVPSVHGPCDIRRDTSGKNVLISTDFIYWGSDGPELPTKLCALRVGRKHKRFRSYIPAEKHVVDDFIEWFKGQREKGRRLRGVPFDWEEDADTSLCVPPRRPRKKC